MFNHIVDFYVNACAARRDCQCNKEEIEKQDTFSQVVYFLLNYGL